MAWGKTEEQKEQEAAARADRRDAAADARADAAFAATPVGQATQARADGQAFFQIELQISTLSGAKSSLGSSTNSLKHTGGRPDVLGQIEEVGWHLEHVGYVFIETGATTTNRVLSTGQGTVTRGDVVGVYLFRAI